MSIRASVPQVPQVCSLTTRIVKKEIKQQGANYRNFYSIGWQFGQRLLDSAASSQSYKLSTIVNYNSTNVNYNSTIVNYKSTIVNYNSTIVNYNSTIVNYNSTIVNYNSIIVNYNSIAVLNATFELLSTSPLSSPPSAAFDASSLMGQRTNCKEMEYVEHTFSIFGFWLPISKQNTKSIDNYWFVYILFSLGPKYCRSYKMG